MPPTSETIMESQVVIEGGRSLNGEVRLSGAKNAALPMLAAACLGSEQTVLKNVPTQMNDIAQMIALLKAVGAKIEVNGTTVVCSRGDMSGGDAPAELAGKVRTSLLLLGLFAGLRSHIFLPQPGGCQIGTRKYDLHLLGLRTLGAEVEERDDGISLKADRLQGSSIDFYLPTTTGTENIMLAAALAEGATTIRNANTRPEVQQLGQLLLDMGAQVKVQNRVVEITGVKKLRGGATITVMPGWDEAVTYIVAAGVTNGEVFIPDFGLEHIREDARYLREAGMELFEWGDSLYASGKAEKQPFNLFTAPYPGVNSDMQPLFAVLALVTPGTSTITDLRFTDRFRYVEELRRFGGDIESFGNSAIIRGGNPLKGANVSAPDLRGGMACVLAGLVAEGVTTVRSVSQIERGYEHFAEKLAGLGGAIKRKAS
jgi:UDP-N-acetylglucosamine 1-carboxyvinyltransferase